ncbi:hypothetical protein AAMO2058_000348700 [Amorphochlora amoebiformis]
MAESGRHFDPKNGGRGGSGPAETAANHELSHQSLDVGGDRGGPQKRTLTNTFKGQEHSVSASSTLLSRLLEEQSVPVLDKTSLNLLSNLKLDEKMQPDEVAKQVDAIKQLVSQIQSSYKVLTNQETNLKRARKLLHEGHQSLNAKETELREVVTFMKKNGNQGQLSALHESLGSSNNQDSKDSKSDIPPQKGSEFSSREEFETLKKQVSLYKRLVEAHMGDNSNQAGGKKRPDVAATVQSPVKAELQRITRNVESYKVEIKKLLDRIEAEQEMMQQVYEMQGKLKKDKDQFVKAQQALTKEQTKVKEARKRNDKMRTQLERDRTQLERERTSIKKKEEDLKGDRARQKKKEEEIQSDKKAVDHERSQLKKELKKLDKEKDKLEDEHKKIDSERKKVRQEKERLKKDVQKANSAKERIEKERAKADQECTNAQKRKDKVLQEIQKAQSEEKKKRQELKEIEETKIKLKAELEQLKKEKRKMEKRPNKSPVQKQQAQKQSSSDETELTGLRRKLLELEAENKRLKKKMETSSFQRAAPDLKSPAFPPKTASPSPDSWGPKIISGPGSNENKVLFPGYGNQTFSQNPWLRSVGSIGLNKTGATPSFTNLRRSHPGQAGAWNRTPTLKENTLLSGFPLSGGTPGFQNPSSKPMGGLMFAQTGSKVMARYSGDNKWYEAEIKDVVIHGGPPKYIVKFKGYAGNEEVSAADIRQKEDASPNPTEPDPLHSNGHTPASGVNVVGHQHAGMRGQTQWGPLGVKNDRQGVSGVWGRTGEVQPQSMVLNGLNGPPLIKPKIGRSQFMEGNFYATLETTETS